MPATLYYHYLDVFQLNFSSPLNIIFGNIFSDTPFNSEFAPGTVLLGFMWPWIIIVFWGHSATWREAAAFTLPASNFTCRKIWLRLSKVNSPLGWVQEWKILAGNDGLSENRGVTTNWDISVQHRRLGGTPTISYPASLVEVPGSMEGEREAGRS